MVHIAPSLLAADFSKLGEQMAEAERAGVDRFHFDVMDGHFVPNLSLGPVILESIRPLTQLPLEVHLMVEDPVKFAEPFVKAGADQITFHVEVLPDPRPLIHTIRNLGKKVGMAVSPGTPVESLWTYLKDLDLALCMTVNPGFGGQKYLPTSDERIRKLRQLIDEQKPGCDLEVDGGIDVTTTKPAVAAGANVLVMGTSIFRFKEGIAAAVRGIRKILGQGS